MTPPTPPLEVQSPPAPEGGDPLLPMSEPPAVSGPASPPPDLETDAPSSHSDSIRQVVRQKSGQVTACYEQRLMENPGIKGQIGVDVEIVAGQVVEVKLVDDTLGDLMLSDCITKKIRAWKFPENVESSVYLPFVLSPG